MTTGQPDGAGPSDASPTRAQKFHCPACGAEAHWNPAKQALICPFCGTESPATLQTRGADTVDRRARSGRGAARHSRLERAAGRREKISVRCQSCQAISVFDADKVGQRCEFCGSAQLVPYEQVKDAFRPESLLPFEDHRVAGARADPRVVRPAVARAEQPRSEGAHRHGQRRLPAVLDVRRHGARALDGRGRQVLLRTARASKRVQRRALDAGSGELSHVFDDELVCASTGRRRRRCCGRSSRFRPTTLMPYDPGYLAGWTVERYQIDLVAAAAAIARSRWTRRCDSCAPSRCPATPIAISQVDATFTRSDVQAHPRAGLAADLHLRRARPTRSSSTA